MPEFNVFLCHNSQDKQEVIKIAEQLQQKGLKPWLDIWELPPGISWQERLEEQIEQIKSAAVFVGNSGFGPWQRREMRAFLSEFVERGIPVIPVLLEDASKQPKLPIFLKSLTWVDFRRPGSNPMGRLIWGITKNKPADFDSYRNDSDENSLSNDPRSLCSLLGTKLKKRYKIITYLGARNCEIYLAQDLDLPKKPKCIVKKLALQSISERDRILFAREVDALDKLGRHEQIPSLLAHFQENNDYYLVEEHIEGQALSEELIESEQWSEEKVIKFLEEALKILQVIHNNGYIHRNINPSNLIRRESDQKLVFTNFGGIKAITRNILSMKRTSYPYTNSSTAYISSEQRNGTPNFCSDIYSIGVIAIQAITGIHPENLRRNGETLDIIWRDSVQNNFNSDLEDVLDRMICYDRQHRYQSVQEVLDGLRKID